jgi:hypothetical protein
VYILLLHTFTALPRRPNFRCNILSRSIYSILVIKSSYSGNHTSTGLTVLLRHSHMGQRPMGKCPVRYWPALAGIGCCLGTSGLRSTSFLSSYSAGSIRVARQPTVVTLSAHPAFLLFRGLIHFSRGLLSTGRGNEKSVSFARNPVRDILTFLTLAFYFLFLIVAVSSPLLLR